MGSDSVEQRPQNVALTDVFATRNDRANIAGAGLNYFNCSDPTTSADLAQGLKTGSDADFSQAGADVLKTGCFLNLTNIDDFMVTQPWLKGISESHIVSDPNSLYLATLSE